MISWMKAEWSALLAKMALRSGRPAQAERHFAKVLAHKPAHTSANLLLAQLRLRANTPHSALVLLNQTLKRQPGHLAARRLRARAFLAMGAVAEAEADFSCISAKGAQTEADAAGLAQALVSQGKTSEAFMLLMPMLQKPSPSPEVRMAHAEALLVAGRKAEALSEYANLHAAHPNDVRVSLGYARAQQRTQKAEGALQTLTEAVAKHPANACLKLEKASVLARIGRFREALHLLDMALRTDPANPELFLARGNLLLLAGQYADAVPDFRKVVALLPNASVGYAQRALAKALTNKLATAWPDLDRAAERAQTTAERALAWRNRGVALLADNRPEEALTAFEQAHFANPALEWTLFYAGLAFAQVGNAAKAIEYLDRAIAAGDTYARAKLKELFGIER